MAMGTASQNSSADAAALLGRLLIAAIFVWAGYGKIGGFDGTVTRIGGVGLPFSNIVAMATIAVELGGALLLVIGYKARWVALGLALFCLAAAVLFHNFWASPAAQLVNQQIHFLKNLAMAGGLLFVFAHGAGRYSADGG